MHVREREAEGKVSETGVPSCLAGPPDSVERAHFPTVERMVAHHNSLGRGPKRQGHRPRRILFVQHAAALGGSCVSLFQMVRNLDRSQFEPVVALARPTYAVQEYYRRVGVEAISWPGMALWDHSTVAPRRLSRPGSWVHLCRVVAGWRRTKRRTLDLIDHVRPDLVHLNSMPLVVVAQALEDAGFPFVWHVREPPEPARGVRYRTIRQRMLGSPELIFLSDYDREQWVSAHRGVVIPNFVGLEYFNPPIEPQFARQQVGLSSNAKVVLFAGGLAVAKGIWPLIEALAIVRAQLPNLACLLPGGRNRAIGAGCCASRPGHSSHGWYRDSGTTN